MSMKLLLVTMAFFSASPAFAQSIRGIMPETGALRNAKGEVIGTVTLNGKHRYMRLNDGTLLGTVETTEKGTTVYDADGKVADFKAAKPKAE